MVWNPWIPMLLGLAMEPFGITIVFLIPETLRYKDRSSDLAERESSPAVGVPLHTYSAAPDTPSTSTALATLVDADGFYPSSWTAWRKSMYRRAQRPIVFQILSDTRIVLIVATFSVHMLFLNRDLMLQYISSRYQVTLAQATALVSIRSGLAFLLCVALLPIVNAYCRNKLFAEHVAQRSDMFLIRTSSVFLTLGFLGIGLAPNLPLLVASLVINSLSWGLWSLLRSLSTDLVREAHHVARLNSLIGIGIIDTVGLMVGSPALAAMFTKGMELGGPWRGLPFVVCGAAVAVLTLILACVGV
ncbi:MFS transporter [Rhypophila decipiens]